MSLLEFFLRRETKNLVKHRIRLHTIGRIEELPAGPLRELKRALAATRHFTEWNLVLALNYGSRTELADAARAYAAAIAAGRENPDEASWTALSRYLYTVDLPDPDLLIRTSGETRLSNFLLMQCAYAELVFSPVFCGPISPRPNSSPPSKSSSAGSGGFGLTGRTGQAPRRRPSPRRQPVIDRPRPCSNGRSAPSFSGAWLLLCMSYCGVDGAVWLITAMSVLTLYEFMRCLATWRWRRSTGWASPSAQPSRWRPVISSRTSPRRNCCPGGDRGSRGAFSASGNRRTGVETLCWTLFGLVYVPFMMHFLVRIALIATPRPHTGLALLFW